MNKSIISFIVVSYAFFMMMVGTNVPTPLYPLYQQALHLNPMHITLIFSSYILGLIPVLYFFGNVSDFWGRKFVLILATLFSILSMFIFSSANTFTFLFIARFIQGVSIGLVSGTASTYLQELLPDRKNKASLITTLCASGGPAIGPLLGGIIGWFSSSSLSTPFYILSIFLIIGLLSLMKVMETKKKKTSFNIIENTTIKGISKKAFYIYSIVGFIAWSVAGIYMSVLPSFITSLLHIKNIITPGIIIFLMFFFSMLSQIIFKNIDATKNSLIGVGSLLFAFFILIVGLYYKQLNIIIFSSIILGMGHGLSFMGSLKFINQNTYDHNKANVVSNYFMICYLGVGLSVLFIGLETLIIGLITSISIFFIIILIISISLLVFMKKFTYNSISL
ncbi:MFS transporter [Staphylococcus pseudoxylosus]|uniref:MFS transporter n=1 Tax=Staphylococcus pseudoxylosus TaxID=2282419 RepID=UPI002DBF53C3|nr:MFS transporter [Staphylococcus pseudoxylosus]MEB7754497.1 MFS transporter [Staphylococcus pseudoxylosus]